jgi:tetratricopeptide (TPR) repeat protein
MVGVAFFERQEVTVEGETAVRDVFVVRQYFLRDHADEPVMLRQLDELLAGKAGLITFNGRSFDVPLLDNRYLMNRLRGRLPDMPHVDLLPPARRLYRARLGSCALSALEQSLLGLQRTEEDVPGWLIPSLYHNYLRTGDARELTRVFYHNQMDMLSMVTLGARIFRNLAASRCDDPVDQLSLGRWQADLGLNDLAEATLRAALDAEVSLEVYHQALQRLGALYKQSGRRTEAVVAWQQIAFTSTDDVSAHVELAKHYEWHENDPAAALEWTNKALALVERWTPTPRSRLTRVELNHRLQRLQKKAG